ncbi:MAG TPA: N-acetylgalactosamine 6-sulfate sulfatase, partial [Opitutae bacterium]|nr:N-acetylgalactosamine 6-sulfate sulfatase [Opitutae bacterium]
KDFATRVIRDKRYKVWVSNQRQIIRLHDLIEDPWEATNLLGSDRAEHTQALKKFQKVIDSLPEKDARPLYAPRAANPWDRKVGK